MCKGICRRGVKVDGENARAVDSICVEAGGRGFNMLRAAWTEDPLSLCSRLGSTCLRPRRRWRRNKFRMWWLCFLTNCLIWCGFHLKQSFQKPQSSQKNVQILQWLSSVPQRYCYKSCCLEKSQGSSCTCVTHLEWLRRLCVLPSRLLSSVVAFHWHGRGHKICHFHHVLSWVNLFPAAFSIRYMSVGLWPWSWGKPDRSAGAVGFNRCTALAKGYRVGRVYLISKREQGGGPRSPTVPVLWEVRVSALPTLGNILLDLLLLLVLLLNVSILGIHIQKWKYISVSTVCIQDNNKSYYIRISPHNEGPMRIINQTPPNFATI